jgi:hypothetical protein
VVLLLTSSVAATVYPEDPTLLQLDADQQINDLEVDNWKETDPTLLQIDSLLNAKSIDVSDLEFPRNEMIQLESTVALNLGRKRYKSVAVGPYKDTADRAMKLGPSNYDGFTKASCAATCSSYKYFAMQYNSQCFCENDFAKSTKYGPAECGENGGGWCNYIFENVLMEPMVI